MTQTGSPDPRVDLVCITSSCPRQFLQNFKRRRRCLASPPSIALALTQPVYSTSLARGYKMPADRTRRTTTSRDAAEAAFKAATTKPAELPPKRPTIPNAKAGAHTASICRHTPKVGAVCGKAACTVLCGGRAMKRASLPLQRGEDDQ